MSNSSYLLGADGIYRCSEFQHFLWQSHGFGTRMANPDVDVTVRQIHSAQVWNAHPIVDRQCEGDALITDDINRRIGIRTADCVPILLLDSGKRAVAAVHAGWRGTVAAIVGRTIEQMHRDFGTQSSDIRAAIGPCIRACCYEVGPEVASQFTPIFPEWPPVAGPQNIDLPEANRRHLLTAGVLADHIYDSGLCTKCLPEHFYSYRREPQNPARLLSVIARLA